MINWPWSYKPPTKEQFGGIMVAAITKAAGGPPPTFDPDKFAVVSAEDRNRLYLDNAYVSYCREKNRRMRDECVRRFVATFLATVDDETESFAEVRPRLLPRVRERHYHAQFALQMEVDRLTDPKPGAPPKPIAGMFALGPFGEHLTIELVQDLPDSIKSVSPTNLKSWGQTIESATAIARDNLWARSNENWQSIGPGLYLSPWRDTHHASRLYLHDLIWQLPVKGRHVAAVPNRDILLVTGDEDAEGLVKAAGLVEQVLAEPRPMTGRFFRLNDRAWEAYLPPPDHPAHTAVRKTMVMTVHREYGDQQHWLRKKFEATGRDCFVAGLTAMRRDDGRLYTFTSWIEGVDDALMPEADQVNFGIFADGTATSAGFARWDRVREIVGHRMEPVEMYPPRYQIRTYPTADELSAMGLTAEPH